MMGILCYPTKRKREVSERERRERSGKERGSNSKK